MNYYLDKRCEEVLKVLLYADHYISINEMSVHLDVSKRTVYYDINKINDWFSYNGIQPITQQRQKGIILNEQQRAFVRQEYYLEQSTLQVFTPLERYDVEICMMLLSKKNLYIEDFAQKCDVSRNTIINDFKQVTKILNQYNLTTSYSIRTGYKVVGDAFKKRALFFLIFPSLWPNILSGINHSEMDEIEKNLSKLQNIEKELKEQYVSGILPALAIFITEIANNEESFQFMNMDEEELMSTKEYELVEKYFPHLYPNEKLYVSLHLLGSRLQTVPVHIINEDNESYKLAIQLIEEFENVTLSTFNNKEELTKAIATHLKSSMYRYRYGIQLGNPMLNDIKNEYSELFEITKRASKVLEKNIGFYITDAEVAYLTLHFGAYIIPKKQTEHHFKILIVCNNGVGTGVMIKNEVRALVPQASEIVSISMNEYNPEHEYDIVISTMFIKEEKNLITVHPILTDLDRVAILRKCIYAEPYIQLQFDDIVKIASKYIQEEQLAQFKNDLKNMYSSTEINHVPVKNFGEGLLYYLDQSQIQIIDKNVDWESAIRLSSSPLLAKDVITQFYIESIIKNQKEKGYYMFLTSDLVLAHSSTTDGVKRVGISMATFRHPVTFLNGKNAKIIITLAAENQTKHIQALNDILKIFQKKKNIGIITELNTPSEIYEFLQKELNTQ